MVCLFSAVSWPAVTEHPAIKGCVLYSHVAADEQDCVPPWSWLEWTSVPVEMRDAQDGPGEHISLTLHVKTADCGDNEMGYFLQEKPWVKVRPLPHTFQKCLSNGWQSAYSLK